MGKLKTFTLPLLAVLLLAGCSGFFEFNMFKGMDTVTPPSAADYKGDQGLDKLIEDLTSPAVVEALKNDPETTAEIEKMLMDDYLKDGVSGEEDQKAALAYAELNLATTSGEELVNNIVDTLADGIPTSGTVTDFLKKIIPPDVQGNPTAFAAMLKGLVDANNAYVMFGESIVDVNGNGQIDKGEGVPPGTNMGDVAQKAIVAYVVSAAVELICSTYALSEDAAIAQLYYLLYDPTNPALVIEDPPASDPYVTQPPYLLNIFAAAGLPFTSQF